MQKNAKQFFDTHKDHNIVFETSDGFLFAKRTDADAHSFSLGNKEVKEHKRTADAVESNVQTEMADLAKAAEESARVVEAKNFETTQSIAAGKIQNEAAKEVSQAASEVMKAAAASIEKEVGTGTADTKDQAAKNAAATVANEAAKDADKVKTTVTKKK